MSNPANGYPYMTIYTPSEEDPRVMEEFDITVWGDVVRNRYVFTTQADNDGVGGEGKEPSSNGVPRASKFRPDSFYWRFFIPDSRLLQNSRS